MSAGDATMNEASAVAGIRGARFPGKYLQGRGVLDRLGDEVALYGRRALVVVDGGVFAMLEPVVRRALASLQAEVVRHGGECSLAEIARLGRLMPDAQVVVGVGGGKALDTAKAVADDLKAASVVVPTIAASDAPCSALAVIYNDDGTVAFDRFLPRNPDLVLVDTQLIAGAPARFLAAGIGDALATWYEAESCRRSGASNCLGVPGISVAHTIARACRDAIFEAGPAAMAECDAKQAGAAMGRVVEANILLSGIGFESGGVAAAHAIHHGLCELDEVHGSLHGEKVAIGVLAGLKLHGHEAEFLRVQAFCRQVRLPTSLADLGIAVTDEKLERVAARACRAGEIIHNEPMPVSPAMVVTALRALT
jgi:glycerol dehydrogenase